jgi:hypothetical protein
VYLAGGASLTAALLSVLLAPSLEDAAAFAAPLLGVVLLVLILHLRLQLSMLSPLGAIIFAYLTTAVFGPLVPINELRGAVSANLQLASSEVYATYIVFLVAVASICVGALLSGQVTVANVPSLVRDRSNSGHSSASATPSRVLLAAALLAMAPFALTLVAYGPELLVRDQYLVAGAGSGPAILVKVLSLPAVGVLGWLSRAYQGRWARLGVWLLIVAYWALLLSLATRELALVPIAAALGRLAADSSSRSARWLVAISGIAAILLLNMPLGLRASPQHGLIPYVEAMISTFGSPFDPAKSVYNVLFSFSLTGAVAFHATHLDWSTFALAIDPRPGSLTTWYDQSPELRINLYTPFNGLGELANHGWTYLIGSYLLIGAFFGYLQNRMTRLIDLGLPSGAILIFGLCCYFVFESLQYNLRSDVRVLYYLLGTDIGLRILAFLSQRRQITRQLPSIPSTT